MDLEKRIHTFCIEYEKNILDALKQMDETKHKLLIVTQNKKYLSLLSIGDIQRAIIKGLKLDTPVTKILRAKNKIRVAGVNDSYASIKQTMVEFKTEFMPVINDKNEIMDIYFWQDVIGTREPQGTEKINIPVVIMAGGEGTRLKPITNIIPKALVPIGEKPILERIIEQFVSIGTEKIILSVNHKHEMIRQYFSNLLNKKYSIEYIQEEKPLGTAGSLHLLKDKIHSSFFVSNCDILVDQDYREVYKYHKNNQNELTIVSALKHYAIPYGTLKTGKDGILKSLVEKPDITLQVNTGMYILEPHLLEEIPENSFFHITTLIENIKKRDGKIGVFPISEKSWIDIGKWKEYQEFSDKYI